MAVNQLDQSGKLSAAAQLKKKGKRSLRFCRKTSLPESKLRLFTKKMKNRLETYYEEEGEESPLNGGFFESNNCSSPRKKTISIQSETDARKRRSSFIDLSSIDSTEMEGIGLSVLQTTLHSSAPGNNTYIDYMQQVLNIQDTKMTVLCEQVQTEQKTELQLACKVKNATQLVLKDLKVLPSVICHLTVVPREKQMDSSFRGQNIMEWSDHDFVSEVKMTKFATATTLSPVWNESFLLHLDDPAEEMVVVELWAKKNKDHKAPATKKPKEYYKKPENFIGRGFYLLKTTPLEGEERTLTLFSHSGKHERGKVTLQLSIKGQREDVPIDVSIREHTILHKLIVNHESKDNGTPSTSWDGKLSAEAEAVILKHVELTGITRLQENSIHLSVLLEYHRFNGMRLASLAALVEDIVQHKLPVDSSRHIWVKQLLFDMRSLHSEMLDTMKNHLAKFNIKASADINEIASCLRILKALFTFPPLLKKLSKDEQDVKSTLEICIQAAVPTWFLELTKSLLIAFSDGEMELVALKALCIHCLRNSLRVHKTLSPIFRDAGIDYFTEFYCALDKLLCAEAMPRIRHFTSNMSDPIIYEMYVVIKDLVKLSEHVASPQKEGLEILTFHECFVGLPIAWIDLAYNKCKARVQEAINLDKSTHTGLDQARYSSSAIDTEGFLLQLGLFWKNLEWPLATDAIGFLCTIIEHISQLSLFYVEALYKTLLLDSAIMYDEKGKFQSSERLCAILNNMYHAKRTLSEMPATLELESYYSWLNSSCNGTQLGDKAKKLVESLLCSHDEDIDNKLSYFVDRITERLTPDISTYFEVILPASHTMPRHHATFLRSNDQGTVNGIHWPWNNRETEEQLTNEEAITPLLSFLTANLQILGDYLLTPVLNGILHKLWNTVLGVVQGRMTVISRKPSSMYLFDRLEYFMRELKTFFHAGGSGMSLPNLETDTYRFIISKLQLLQMDAKELIVRLFCDLSEHQKYLDNYSITTVSTTTTTISSSSSSKEASLQVSIGFLIDKALLEVSIIRATNLPGNDKLNSYVELYLLPSWTFTNTGKKARRTSVTKGTRSPYYGEEFNMSVSEDEIISIGASVFLAIRDDDRNTTLGIGCIQGIEIPHLYGHVHTLAQQKNVPERRKMNLTLFTQKETPAIKEMESRMDANDQEIVELWKSHRRVFELVGYNSKNTLTRRRNN